MYKLQDSVLQALAYSLGMSIKKECLNAINARLYVDIQMKWVKKEKEALKEVMGNKYKILAKFLQVSVRNKKNMGKEKLNQLRRDLISTFLLTDTKSLVGYRHIQVLSRLNGISFGNNTITGKGRRDITKLATKFCDKGTTMLYQLKTGFPYIL
jgi:hypothetical protein